MTRSLAAEGAKAGGAASRPGVTPVIAARAAAQLDALRAVVADWYAFYNGYDPVFTWWTGEPFARLDAALVAYADALRRHLVGIRPGEPAPLVGDPVLADGLRADLAFEMIPYSADELIAIGMTEFEWIEGQFRIVSRRSVAALRTARHGGRRKRPRR